MKPWLAAARAVGVEVASRHADDVDRRARFPAEAFAALKKEKLLGIAGAEERGRCGRRHRRRRGDLPRARPALRRDGDDLRDAPDPGRLHRPARRRQRLAEGLPEAGGGRAAPARLGDLGSRRRRRRALQHLRGRGAERAFQAHQGSHRHLLRRRGRRHPGDGAAHAAFAGLRPGDRGGAQNGLRARAGERMGHARHARHLLQRLSAAGQRRDGAGRAGVLRRGLGDDHAAGLAPGVERAVARHRHRRGGAHPRLCAGAGAQEGRGAVERRAARRGVEPAAAHEGERRRLAAPVRGGAGLGGRHRRACVRRRHEQPQDRHLADGGAGHQPVPAGLRPGRLPQRLSPSASGGTCAMPIRRP